MPSNITAAGTRRLVSHASRDRYCATLVKTEHLNLANACSNLAATCTARSQNNIANFFENVAGWHRDRAAGFRIPAPGDQAFDRVGASAAEDNQPTRIVPLLERLLEQHQALGLMVSELWASERSVAERLPTDEALAVSRAIAAIRKILVVARRTGHLSDLERWMDREGSRVAERLWRPGTNALFPRQP